MSDNIDLDYRPSSFFGPQKLEDYLISQVKSAVLKRRLRTLFDEGRHAEVEALLGDRGISPSDLKAIEKLHPMFMGGNYLPDAEDGEVEIARIRISSTTYDVTSVLAKADHGVIRYRVVDEYDGDTLTDATETASEVPLTLGQLADFLLGAWPMMNVLEMNFGDDVRASLGFFKADSKFYPDFDRVLRLRVQQRFTSGQSGETSEL